MRKLATIRQIKELAPIKGADRIEKATVDGWELIVKKDEFQVGDLCVYIEIDSVVPKEDIRYEFLMKRKYRIRTLKLRNTISQGIAFPLSLYPELENAKLGDDVTEILKVTKYDPEALKERNATVKAPPKWYEKTKLHKYLLRYKWYRGWINPPKGNWPTFIKKTDEERVQNMPWIIRKIIEEDIYITEKLDGQSATFFLKKYSMFKRPFFGVCSRNIFHKTQSNNNYWTIAKQYNIEKKLRDYYKETGRQIVLQGEIIGDGIQANKYGINGLKFYVFNALDLKTNQRLNYVSLSVLCGLLELDMVPVLLKGEHFFTYVQGLVEYSKGVSVLNKNTLREGIVIRNTLESNISFKVINPEFLLHYKH